MVTKWGEIIEESEERIEEHGVQIVQQIKGCRFAGGDGFDLF